MDHADWLHNIRSCYERHKRKCERAAAQVSDEDFFRELAPGEASIGVLMRHLGGNLRSRWRDFLTTDGEKTDRDREGEFVVDSASRGEILEEWQSGWQVAFASLDALAASDLSREVSIRGEPMGVVHAIHRNLLHVAYHTGQLILLARHWCGSRWSWLSVPPGQSEAHNEAMRAKHGDWAG